MIITQKNAHRQTRLSRKGL